MENNPLKIIPIGGTTTVQKNMYVYESGNDIVVFDCGIGFPDSETPGVDIILPDFTYVLENREKVRGIVITHGHDDHRSSLPYLLKEYNFPVYAMPFVKGLIEKALEEHTDLKHVKINAFNPEQPFQLGIFKIHPFRVNHSIPDTMGFAIDTPQGRVFHNTDFKFDWTPVMDKPFDVQKAARLAGEPENGVLALLSDCLGSTTEGFTESEKIIQETFERTLEAEKGKQIFITTISSNISRIQQAINASVKAGRKVVLSGRSIRETMGVAKEMGYIKAPEDVFVDDRDAHSHDQSKLTYIITGCYGQRNAGLWRAIRNDHKQITMEPNAVVIFSADPIPNSVQTINQMIDELYLRGAKVYYSEIQENFHVSGHGARGDMTLLANIVKPKFFIPIGGNVKHMRAYAQLVEDWGFSKDKVWQLLDGQSIIFENGNARLGPQLNLKEVYVDGNRVGDVGTIVLEDRKQMANDGMVAVVVKGQNVEMVTRGFVFVKESKDLINKANDIVKKSIGKQNGKENGNVTQTEKKIEQDLNRFFYKETGRSPLIVVNVG